VETEWALKLFSKSVLKQRKLKEITSFLGSTSQLQCLDIGGDNGVISYMLRKYGGDWKSADLDPLSVESIKHLVQADVYQIDGSSTPFQPDEFDRVVIVDFLEHIPNDEQFIIELHRITKPGGVLVVNVPHIKQGVLRKLRLVLGQTDEKHGHLRPGYSYASLEKLFGDKFVMRESKTYSKFFSELIDILIVGIVTKLKNGDKAHTKKGLIVTQDDINQSQAMFRVYSLIYPIIRAFSLLDGLLFFRSGYMLIASARVNKSSDLKNSI